MTKDEALKMALEEKFSLLLWDYQELERAFEKETGGKWVRKSNTPQRTWVGLEKSDMPDGADPLFDDPKFIAGIV